MPEDISTHTLPLGYFLTLLGILFAGLIGLALWAFQKNEASHGNIWKKLRQIGRKVDHLIHHNKDTPNYNEADDGSE